MAEKEYIERGAAIEFIEQYTPHFEGETTLRCVKTALENVPAADVVEVVRCYQCKYAQGYKCAVDPCYQHMKCTRREHYTEGVDEYDFCSYGERREK